MRWLIERYTWLLLLAAGAVAGLGLAGYRAWGLAAASLQLAAASSAIAVPTGTLLAVLAIRTDLPGRRIVQWVLAWMLFVPLYVQVGAWQAGFGWQGWQTQFGLGPAWLVGWRGAVWVQGAAGVPWVAVIVASGLRWLPRSVEESALLDAGTLRVLSRVTLPSAAGLIAAAALWVAVAAAGEFAVSDQFQIRTYAEEVYTQTALGAAPQAISSALAPGVALVAWLIAVAWWTVVRLASPEAAPHDDPPAMLPLFRWRWPCALLVAAIVALLVGLPLVNLAWKSGVIVVQTPEGRSRFWSAAKCLAVVAGSPLRYGRETAASVVTGGAAATLTLALAVLLAWSARARRGGRVALLATSAAALAIPGPLVGLGIIACLNRPEVPLATWLYDRTIAAPVLAQMVRCLPAAALVCWYAMATIPRDETDSAALEGAGWLARLVRIALPQRRAALAAAWLVALALAMGEVGGTILVAPPGVEPLAIRISGLLHYGVEDEVAGICLALFLISGVLAGGVGLLIRRGSSIEFQRTHSA